MNGSAFQKVKRALSLIQYNWNADGSLRADRIVLGDGRVQQVVRGTDPIIDVFQFLLMGPVNNISSKRQKTSH